MYRYACCSTSSLHIVVAHRRCTSSLHMSLHMSWTWLSVQGGGHRGSSGASHRRPSIAVRHFHVFFLTCVCRVVSKGTRRSDTACGLHRLVASATACACVRVYMHACMRGCIRGCVCACARVRVCVCVHMCMRGVCVATCPTTCPNRGSTEPHI